MVCLAIKLTEARIVALSNKGHKLNPLVVTLKTSLSRKEHAQKTSTYQEKPSEVSSSKSSRMNKTTSSPKVTQEA